jgi:hypothetical protein
MVYLNMTQTQPSASFAYPPRDSGSDLGVAIVKSKLLSKWICGAGVVIGAVIIYAGLEVAYLGFGGLTTIIGISMIIYFIWIGILGGLMWKKSMSMSKEVSPLIIVDPRSRAPNPVSLLGNLLLTLV